MSNNDQNEGKMEPIHIHGRDDFNAKISNGLTLVDFWAQWCHPCLSIAEFLKELTFEWKDKIAIAKVDIQEGENNQIAGEWGVLGIPNLILFHNGKAVDRVVGAAPKPVFTEFLKRNYEKFKDEIEVRD
jgi:thioredoxin 1